MLEDDAGHPGHFSGDVNIALATASPSTITNYKLLTTESCGRLASQASHPPPRICFMLPTSYTNTRQIRITISDPTRETNMQISNVSSSRDGHLSQAPVSPGDHSQVRQQNSRLLDLPPELRNQIYRHVLHEPNKIVIPTHGPIPTEPGLVRTCREIRAESLLIYYQENKFEFEVRSFDISTYLHWCMQSKIRRRRVRVWCRVFGVKAGFWPDLKMWLKATFMCQARGWDMKDTPTGIHPVFKAAGRMFETVRLLGRDMVANQKDVEETLEVLENVLESMRVALSLTDARWK